MILSIPQLILPLSTTTNSEELIRHPQQNSHLCSTPQVHAYLFTNVIDTQQLLTHLRHVPPILPTAVYLDASKIFSLFQLSLAVTKTHLNKCTNKMRTHSDQSEILLSLSGDTSISQAFKQFGISKHTCNVLVVDYSGNDQIENHNQEILQDLTRHIHGTHIAEFTDLDNIRDMKAIRKIYSIPTAVEDLQEIESLIVGTMALQGNTK
ncbi:hypothetical protein O5D80_007564 [Batrachochytrium dendrobatidis]|nr:hypothetical protein O5D80_007564 [Batrachochytrium dendrobatidis]